MQRGWTSVAGATALSLLFSLFLVLPDHAATGSGVRAPQTVRSIWTSDFGIPRPTGLAYDPARGEFLVAQADAGGTLVSRLTLGEESRGTFRLPTVTDPRTLSFDPTRDQLSSLTGGVETISSRAGAVVATKKVDLGVHDPTASTYDPSTGTWYVLDGATGAIVAVPRSGGPSRISVERRSRTRLGALAFNPADGRLYVSAPDRGLLYAVDRAGSVRSTFRLRGLDLRNAGAMTFAPSADATDDASVQHLYVAEAGDASRLGAVTELTLAEAVALAEPNVSATLVQTIDTALFSPASPDPSGITYIPSSDRLMVADSEVDETTGAGFHGVNLWKITRAGVVVDTGNLTPWTSEPTGLGFDGSSNTLFVSTDSGDRVYVMKPGIDGRFGTSDDVVTFVNAGALGSTDTEDPEYDPATGDLFFIDGTSTEVYRINPVDGVFGNGNDVSSHFDVGQFGATDVEGLASDQARGTLLVGVRTQKKILEVTKTGELVRTIDVSAATGLRFVSGLSMAPSTTTPGKMNYWIVDRAVDNGANPSENDGKIFELTVPGSSDLPPTVTITSPAEGATVSGTIPIVANASDVQGVNQVQFFVGSTSIGTDTNGTNGWSVSWNTTTSNDGPVTITATATDTIGQTGSDSNGVTVDNFDGPPTVTITAPPDGAAVTGTVQIQANASDDKGVTQVRFTDGATPIGTDTNGADGWSVGWNTSLVGEGAHSLVAIATDTIGQTGTDTNAVTVDRTAPSVSITSPTAGSKLTGTVTVTASASDAVGVASVQFFSDATSIGSDTNGADGWSVPWNSAGAGNGTHVLSATATDAAGNPATSAPVSVTVDNPSIVDVSIAAGADDVEERANGSVTLTSTDLDLLLDGTNVQRAVGLRFAGVNVPRGVNVIDAYVQFQADEVSTDVTNLTVRGQASDNAAPFAAATFNVTNRPTTGATVAWSPAQWPQVNARGPAQRTPNLESVLDEIFARPGWSAGNALVLSITGSGRRVADAFEGSFAPLLHIQFGAADDKPTVSITNPAEGETVVGTVQVQATAADDKGVTQVAFFDGATPLGTDTNGSDGWSAAWSTVGASEGAHTITATATDTIGQTTSDTNLVTVDNVDDAPTVAISSPSSGANLRGAVTIQANAADDHGVAQVEFFDGATPIGTDTNGANGWSVSWNTAAVGDGSHSLTAVATDTASHTTTSASVGVTVDNTAPGVSLTAPASGSTIVGTIPVTATASDANGVGSVTFVLDGSTQIGADTNGADGWGIQWNSTAAANGPHQVTAVAADLAGNPTTSAPASITLDNPLVVNVPIAVSGDDVEEKSNGGIAPGSGDLDMLLDNQSLQRAVGLRFIGVNVPPGATILDAYVQFQTDKASTAATSLTIQGEASNSAPAFPTVRFNLTNRPRTAASIAWTPPAWATAGARGPDQRTPQLGAVLSEIFARPGWASGNAIVLIVTGTGERVAESFDGSFAPVLHIEYKLP